jgi:hypothetical protein
LLDKARQSLRFNAPQVRNHAHAVFSSIPLVHMTKPLAGEARAAEANILTGLKPLCTGLDSAANAGLRLAAIVTSAARAFVPATQESATKPAIHPARRD